MRKRGFYEEIDDEESNRNLYHHSYRLERAHPTKKKHRKKNTTEFELVTLEQGSYYTYLKTY